MSPTSAHDSAERGRQVRMAARAGTLSSHTAGVAPGNLQGNLVVLPNAYADDFAAYCARNPAPCPVIGRTRPGDPGLPALGRDIDIRCDLPAYRVWRDGDLVAEPHDVLDLWRADSVGFVIGCSFSFEAALLDAGIPLRHIEQGVNVAMYVTDIETAPMGPFGGGMVVSMRPIRQRDLARVEEITARAAQAHGAPVHWGDPAAIGIKDIASPDFGDAVHITAEEVPVFWACGVTPQVALRQARIPLAITHKPGSMLVTDLPLDHVARAA
ncbi:MAG: hypothetical protein CMM50_06225 [Rhodospirillaceae bacterium]|nr:hypothetical protein [Rhodospirillaceae bacterium]